MSYWGLSDSNEPETENDFTAKGLGFMVKGLRFHTSLSSWDPPCNCSGPITTQVLAFVSIRLGEVS